MPTLLVPREVDRLLRYPRGRSLRLAKAGKFKHIVLPDGEVRFSEDAIEALLTAELEPSRSSSCSEAEVANA